VRKLAHARTSLNFESNSAVRKHNGHTGSKSTCVKPRTPGPELVLAVVITKEWENPGWRKEKCCIVVAVSGIEAFYCMWSFRAATQKI
jgi:hypothetical protein